MKLAYLTEDFPAASETFIQNQIAGLAGLGHHVHVFANELDQRSTGTVDESIPADIHVSRRPRLSGGRIRRATQAVRLLLEDRTVGAIRHRVGSLRHLANAVISPQLLVDATPFAHNKSSYDAMVCHFGPNGLRGLRLRKFGSFRAPIVTVFHGWDMSSFLKVHGEGVYDELFREGDLFLPISEYWRRRLVELGCPPQKIRVHHMGVDCGRFRFLPRAFQSHLPVRIVSIARLVEKKGIEDGIRAVARLLERGVNLEYRIVGDGPLFDPLGRLSDRLNVSNRIQLVGGRSTEEVAAILRDAHVLLAPSVTAADGDKEGIPVALMEAMASGMVVLTTVHSGIPELVSDGVTGFLVSERDDEALAARLNHIVSHPESWPAIGAEARRKIEAEFDVDRLNVKLVGILEDLQRARPARTE